MDPEIEALLNFVNGKRISGEQFLLIVQSGFLQLTPKALDLLQQLKGAIHDWTDDGPKT